MAARICRSAAFIGAAAALLVLVTRHAPGPVSAAMPQSSAPPTRIVLGWAGDAATTRAVTWRTRTPADAPRAEIGLASAAAEGTAAPPVSVPATARPVALGGGRTVTHYRAEFTGLKPATTYAYRVGGGSAFSPWHRFTTASAAPAPFRFIYLGDAQSGLDKKWPAVVRAAFAVAPDARFVVHGGDLLSDGYDSGLWGSFVAGLGEAAATVPHLPVPGNNDVRRVPAGADRGRVLRVSPLWNAHFALPPNGPAGLPDLEGQNYVVDYQGVRIVALDVNAFANEEFGRSAGARVRETLTAWLRQVLGTGSPRWRIVVQHYPHHSVVKRRDYPAMRDALAPIYDEYGVDLVLQGHDHAYSRTHKVFDGHLADDAARGTVYATSVSGPETEPITTKWKPLMAALREGALLYQVIGVENGRLTYEACTAAGKPIDAFSLSRPAGAAPGTPAVLSQDR